VISCALRTFPVSTLILSHQPFRSNIAWTQCSTNVVSFSCSFSQPVKRDWRRRFVRCADGQMRRGTGERTSTNSKCVTERRKQKTTSEWQPVGETANSETMVAAHTHLQRACPRQRVSTMTLLLAPRQLGSQGGSSSTLSQSDSTRDLARFTRPRAHTCHPPHPASHLWVLRLHPSYRSSLLLLTEV